ncbi:hypothetical protein [Staphylococcus haemolyticus]|uniref:hypothetical protein n=1 Tax=Staphylococcus haemolyticus TaxID=1283 RepID=UPI00069F0F6A|nr:hypothetical protein [Staphylococcus haemolyticus]
MSDIYIILYTHRNSIDGDSSWVDDFYFTDKNKAIKHLEVKDYVHEQDDMYIRFCTNAEIILLNKQEEQ